MKRWIEFNIETREIVTFHFGSKPNVREDHDAIRVPDTCSFSSEDTIDSVLERIGVNKSEVIRDGIFWESV